MFSNIHNHPGLPNYGTHLFIHSTDIYEQLPETNPQKILVITCLIGPNASRERSCLSEQRENVLWWGGPLS